MTPAILSAGPSAKHWNRWCSSIWDHSPILTVNRAARLILHHWLVAGDHTTLDELHADGVIPMTGICTMRCNHIRVDQYHRWRDLTWTWWEDLPGHGVAWCRKHHAEGHSLVAAFALAHHLGASSCDLYGHDQALDAADCAGARPPEADRSAARWQRETDELASLFQHLPITVHQHHPEPPCAPTA